MVTNQKDNTKLAMSGFKARLIQGYPVDKPLEIDFAMVRSAICKEPSLTDMEIFDFLNFCQITQLNPFLKKVYLIKFPGQAAFEFIAFLTYLEIAEMQPSFKGYEAGIIFKNKTTGTKMEFRQGEILLDDELLLGGYAYVYRSDRDKPIYIAVNLKEYQRRTKEGHLMHFWSDQPTGMIRKVALAHALREAYPGKFGNTTIEGEYDEMKEGELPEPFMKDNAIEWRKVYAKLGEMGITHDDACQMLKIKSIKEDWIDKGQTIGDFVETIAELLVKTGHLISAEQENNNIHSPSENEPIKENIEDNTSAATTNDDILFPEIEATTVPKYGWDWARGRINELKDTTHPKIEQEIKERFIKEYHLQESLLPRGIKGAVDNLYVDDKNDFYTWLSKL